MLPDNASFFGQQHAAAHCTKKGKNGEAAAIIVLMKICNKISNPIGGQNSRAEYKSSISLGKKFPYSCMYHFKIPPFFKILEYSGSSGLRL